ncbi:MAG: VPLPA-CTERM sorting domain-containing protein, partial [Gammaproteobacteria bacterium]
GLVDRSTTTSDLNDQLQITLNNGDEFYVLAALTAAADGTESIADAFSTFGMNFNTTQLVPAAVVPLPAAVWLFGSGLLGLIGISRRMKKA